MRGGEEEWFDVKYRKRSGQNSNRKVVTTFFVTNLPGGVSDSMLWMAFQPHGRVKDAYVARKRDSRGNFFGFVRYEGVTDVEKVLQGMNTVKIYEAKVSVSLAKFDKNHNRIVHQVPQGKPKHGNPTTQPEYRPVKLNTTVGVSEDVSFRDMVTGSLDHINKLTKVVTIDDQIATYPEHCMMRSVIVEVKDVMALEEIRTLLDVGGYRDNPVCYLGGLMCMIVFKEKTLAVDFIEKEGTAWSSVISKAVLWKGQDVTFERLVWLKIEGIPIQLRDNKVFEKVGEMFGRIIGGSDFSWTGSDNSCGRCWVVTELGKRIDEAVEIGWQNRKFKIWVSEDHNPKFKDIIAELSSGTPSSPVPSVESDAGFRDDIEEGEIRLEGIPVAGGGTSHQTVGGDKEDEPILNYNNEIGGSQMPSFNLNNGGGIVLDAHVLNCNNDIGGS